MFEAVKKLQAFEGLKISDFRHNILKHQFICFNCYGNGSSGGPGGGGASEVTAITASATSSAAAAAGKEEVCPAGMQKNPSTSSTHQLAGS